jgi:hypothetical protein
MLVSALVNQRTLAGILKKTVWTAIGFLAPLALLILGMLASGTDMISALRIFATSITQGSFAEGWSQPFAYFWHTEHVVSLILGVLSVYAIINLFRTRQRYASVWAGGMVFIYLCLLIPSVFLHSFVVYARLARQLLPFVILLAANGLALLEERKLVSYPMRIALLTITLVQTVWNFGTSYQLYYPRQFSEELQSQYRGFEFSTKRLAYGAPTLCQSNGYIIENTKYFLSAPKTTQPVNGELLREVLHPVNFLPYQYEGYTPEQRQEFREGQLKMRFYKVDHEFLSGPGMEIKNCAIRGTEE